MASWLAERKPQAIWYTLDAGDGNLTTFFDYLGSAAKVGRGDAEALPHLKPESALGLPVFVAHWFERLFARFDPPFVLVLDNLHEIPAASSLHDALSGAIAQLPGGAGIVLVSRNDPPAAYARWAASGQFTRIDWEDLRFTDDEARAIASACGHADPEEVVVVNAIARGWVAGLVLLLRARDEGLRLPARSAEVPRAVFDYFATEIFAKLPLPLRSFLLQTAVLPVVIPEVAAALSGQANAAEILFDLARQGLFTERRSTVKPAYAYHPLFRDFLQDQARKAYTATQLHAVGCHAAKLLNQAGDIDGAAALLVVAEDWAELGRLCCRHAEALMKQGRHQDLARWIDLVPEAVRDAEPWLCYWHGTTAMLMHTSLGQASLERAFHLFDARGDRLLALIACGAIVTAYSLQWGDLSQLDFWIATLDRLVAERPRYPSEEVEARVLASLLGIVVRQPGHPLLEGSAERAQELLHRTRDARIGFLLAGPVITYFMWKGRFRFAAEALSDIESLIDVERSPPFAQMKLLTWRALVKWQNAEHTCARESVEKALQIGRAAGVAVYDGFLYMLGIHIALSAEDVGLSRRYVQAWQAGLRPTCPLEAGPLRMLDAVSRMFEGDLDGAISAAREILADPQALGSPLGFATLSIQFGQLLLLKGEHGLARQHLAHGLRHGNEAQSDIVRFHALINLSYSWLETGNEAKALDALRRALAIGHKQNYLNCHPLWIPKIMARVFAAALAHDITPEYVRRFIRHRALRPEAGAVESWPWPIKIRVLGGFELLKDEAPLPSGGKARHKPLELLKAVAALGGRAVPAAKLADALWPDADGDAAQHAFDTTVYRLRKLLDQPAAVVIHDMKVSLNPECCWLDVWAFEELQVRTENLQRDRPASEDLARIGEAALRLYRGDLLPHESEAPWLHTPRRRLHGRFLRLIAAIGRHRENAGQWDRAAELYQKALEIDPLTETWYRQLMVCHQRRNRPAEALAVYQGCQNVLSEVLKSRPSTETEAVYRSLQRG